MQVDNTAEIIARLDSCVAGVNQVRERQAEWHLNDDQKRKIRNRLAGSRTKAAFHLLSSDANAGIMAIDLADALSAWDLQPGGPDFRLNPALAGIVLVVTHADFPAAVALQSALADVGIKAPVQVDTKKEWVDANDLIFIAIGRKP